MITLSYIITGERITRSFSDYWRWCLHSYFYHRNKKIWVIMNKAILSNALTLKKKNLIPPESLYFLYLFQKKLFCSGLGKYIVCPPGIHRRVKQLFSKQAPPSFPPPPALQWFDTQKIFVMTRTSVFKKCNITALIAYLFKVADGL